MRGSLQALEAQCSFFTRKLAELTDSGAPPEVLAALRTASTQAQKNYWTAANSALCENDDAVARLVSDMNALQADLTSSLDRLDSVVKVVNGITKAVEIGSKLAEKVVA